VTEVSSAHQRELLLDDGDDIVQGARVYDDKNSTSCRPIWLESPGRSGTTDTPVVPSRDHVPPPNTRAVADLGFELVEEPLMHRYPLFGGVHCDW
jgi:hypothetical protein